MKPYGVGILQNSSIYFCNSREAKTNFLFYPLCVGHYYCDHSYAVKRVNYNSFLVLYVMAGSVYYFSSGIRRRLQKGQFMILDCYQSHQYGSDTGCEILWVHLDGPQARSYYNYIHQCGNPAAPADPEVSYRYMERLYRVYDQKQIVSDALVSKYIVGILTEFMIENPQESMTMGNKMKLVQRYIDDNLTEPLSLQDLASHADLSVYYFTRQFKKQFGYTPHEYVINARLKMAKFYLKTSDMAVKTVAFRCGFTDESSFCTSFKKWSGRTPAEYRSLGLDA